MSMLEWAKKEIELAKSEEGTDGYYIGCCNSALKAFETLCNEGHSGLSIQITKSILNRLIDGKPLSPITEKDEWNHICDNNEDTKYKTYQCCRQSSLFKDVYDDGNINYTDVNRVICVNTHEPDLTYGNGYFTKLIHEMYPITLPYTPGGRYKAYIESSVKHILRVGDDEREWYDEEYEVFGLLYIIKPDGTKETIERYFVDYEGEPRKEITKEGYDKLKIK